MDLGAKVKIVFNPSDQFNIAGYPNELGQALLNIINNAKDALIQNNIQNKNIKIDLKNNGEDIIINIADNAGGIPQNIIDKIFDPYFSTKNEKNGTGIGLYMTKIIIEEHMNGSLIVENVQDGAVFKIVLKLYNGIE